MGMVQGARKLKGFLAPGVALEADRALCRFRENYQREIAAVALVDIGRDQSICAVRWQDQTLQMGIALAAAVVVFSNESSLRIVQTDKRINVATDEGHINGQLVTGFSGKRIVLLLARAERPCNGLSVIQSSGGLGPSARPHDKHRRKNGGEEDGSNFVRHKAAH